MWDVVLVICLGLGGFVLGLSLFCCVLILVLGNVMGYSVRVGDIGVFFRNVFLHMFRGFIGGGDVVRYCLLCFVWFWFFVCVFRSSGVFSSYV